MGLSAEIAKGFTRVRTRLEEIVARMRSQDARLQQIELMLGLGAVPDPNALPLAVGNAVRQIGEILVAKVTSKGTGGEYTAVRRCETSWGVFEDDPDDTSPISIKTLPASGDGSGASDLGELIVGEHVFVSWLGRSDSDEDYYHVIGRASGGAWWGLITACDPVTGLGQAKPVAGTYPALTLVAGAAAVPVLLGTYAPVLRWVAGPIIAAHLGHFVPSGPGVTPAWTLNQHVHVAYREPSANLAPTQDDGGGTKVACTAGGA